MKLAKGSAPWISAPILLSAALAAAGSWYMSALAMAGSIFMIFFHRDPDRLPEGEGMLAPADGKVVQAARDGIAIFMSPSSVHVNRAPLDGLVRNIEYRKGTHLPAFLGRACENQQNRMHLSTDDGEMELRQITGTLVREIVCYVRPGDRISRGERIGMVRFGSRVEVSIPPGYNLQVKNGDSVRAGQTVVAVRGP
ncbi:MAG TPA: phosphatidylserine decarboxylase [Methanothrix sp.]|nr:phosphatidylserine decarboxylase [Methanothrix sp.]HPC88900.1 phosphatidylserine decarboxylase [Methanothrix sp.]HQE86677.1 phosphatidylserine decarboxylase [Methanothrix sp.]HQI67207.1 phosphatidylserine decarboxylase [Methanothrix sp.]HRS84201.1 phosphatidylserine decarboxylase [Methanothrix sp.]